MPPTTVCNRSDPRTDENLSSALLSSLLLFHKSKLAVNSNVRMSKKGLPSSVVNGGQFGRDPTPSFQKEKKKPLSRFPASSGHPYSVQTKGAPIQIP